MERNSKLFHQPPNRERTTELRRYIEQQLEITNDEERKKEENKPPLDTTTTTPKQNLFNTKQQPCVSIYTHSQQPQTGFLTIKKMKKNESKKRKWSGTTETPPQLLPP